MLSITLKKYKSTNLLWFSKETKLFKNSKDIIKKADITLKQPKGTSLCGGL